MNAEREIDNAAHPLSDAVRAEFAPTGVLRAGINLGNPVIAQREPRGGDPRGVGPGLARELAGRLGVPIRFVTFETAGKLADAAKEGVWDVAFLAIDPARATDIEFTSAYVNIEGTYMVPEESSLRSVDEFDRDDVRIAVGLKTAYDLFLTREMKRAQLIRAESSTAAIDLFLKDGLDAVAGVRQPLLAASAAHPNLRVLATSFMVIRQAAGVPKGRPAAARYLAEFIEKAKASGLVARTLKESGVADVSVAPAVRNA
jgi:polar amino acid transport system substrate-binding protein